MATETTIKFRRGRGIPVVGNAFASDSIGEPLWDYANKKLYVTNGGETPVLIGPTSLTVIPEYNVGDGGQLLATVTINNADPILIYAPANTGDTAVTQDLDVVDHNDTNPTLITLTDTNSIELESSPANTNVTTVITGESAGASENGKAKLLFDVHINVIDGGEW